MPIYEYECANGHRFEVMQKLDDPPPKTCQQCRSRKLRRLLASNVGVQFRGSGFYTTDYARKDQAGGKDARDRS